MFANFLQITINSHNRKHRLFDLNNIGKGDFLLHVSKLGKLLSQKLFRGLFSITSGCQKLHLQIYQKII